LASDLETGIRSAPQKPTSRKAVMIVQLRTHSLDTRIFAPFYGSPQNRIDNPFIPIEKGTS
jgi:hypothetical protein